MPSKPCRRPENAGVDGDASLTRTMRIVNEKGLHARASARFAECVEGFDADALVRKDGVEATGDSIMGLLMLGAARGSTIEVTARGPEAEPLLAALGALVEGRFGEDR